MGLKKKAQAARTQANWSGPLDLRDMKAIAWRLQ